MVEETGEQRWERGPGVVGVGVNSVRRGSCLLALLRSLDFVL